MAKKTHRPEEVVAKLRQVDVLHGQGADGGGDPPGRRERSHISYLWTALPVQDGLDLTLDKPILTEAAKGN